MSKAGLTKATAEALLEGTGPIDGSERELLALLTEMRALAPSSARHEDLPATLASVARDNHRVAPRSTGRLVFLAATVGLVLAMAGVAIASDDSYPGHPLYAVDVAFERIGVGSGGAAERLAEVETLLEQGKVEEANNHLERVVPLPDRVVTPLEPSSATVADSVEAKKAFIEANKGNGVGADGADFGHGVAALTPGHQKRTPDDNVAEAASDMGAGSNDQTDGGESVDELPDANSPGRSAEAGPKEDAGPKDKANSSSPAKSTESSSEPGPPAHAGPKESAGPKDR